MSSFEELEKRWSQRRWRLLPAVRGCATLVFVTGVQTSCGRASGCANTAGAMSISTPIISLIYHLSIFTEVFMIK
jgi:hypothetical protein